jgi:hypothetical protein
MLHIGRLLRLGETRQIQDCGKNRRGSPALEISVPNQVNTSWSTGLLRSSDIFHLFRFLVQSIPLAFSVRVIPSVISLLKTS